MKGVGEESVTYFIIRTCCSCRGDDVVLLSLSFVSFVLGNHLLCCKGNLRAL